MVKNAYPFPGGKSTLAHWVIDQFPPHEGFVDVFHGGGSILVQKPESKIEVVNDKDSDIVQFLRVLRERPDDLREWFESITVARDTHRRFGEPFYGRLLYTADACGEEDSVGVGWYVSWQTNK